MSLRLLSAVTLKRNGTDTRHLESVPRRHVVKRISHSAAILPRKRNTRFRWSTRSWELGVWWAERQALLPCTHLSVPDISTPDFPGIFAGDKGFFGPRLTHASHPHMRLEESMTSVPTVSPGDMVFWHCDVVHSVEQEHTGQNDSSGLPIEFFLLVRNSYLSACSDVHPSHTKNSAEPCVCSKAERGFPRWRCTSRFPERSRRRRLCWSGDGERHRWWYRTESDGSRILSLEAHCNNITQIFWNDTMMNSVFMDNEFVYEGNISRS